MNQEKTIDPYLGLMTFCRIEMFEEARKRNGFNFPDNQDVQYDYKNGIMTIEYIDRIDQLTQGEGEPIEESIPSFMTIDLLENNRIEQLYDKLQEVFEVIESHEIFINPIK
jgi:hypothetical protein